MNQVDVRHLLLMKHSKILFNWSEKNLSREVFQAFWGGAFRSGPGLILGECPIFSWLMFLQCFRKES